MQIETKTMSPQQQTKKKRGQIRVFRRIVQIAAFLLFPGLFITTYSALRDVFTALVHGDFRAAALMQQLGVLAAILPITILMGRFFCGFLCAFGAMGDLLWFVSGKLFRRRPVQVPEQTERWLKRIKYAILLGSMVFLWAMELPFDSRMDPWTIFGMYASLSGWSNLGYLCSIGAALLVTIMLGSLFVERFFCRYLCPLGAVFAIVSRVRVLRLQKPRQHCGSCRMCTAKCSMGLPLYQTDAIASGECIDCMNCVVHCPRGNVTTDPRPMVASVIAVAATTGLYYAGGLLPQETVSTIPETVVTQSVQRRYNDGVYTGSGTGYKGSTTVRVTVKNGNISAIDVLSTGDDQSFFDHAKSTIISGILSSQSTEVDTVSGATFSSNGIIDAVKDALSSAGAVSAHTQGTPAHGA